MVTPYEDFNVVTLYEDNAGGLHMTDGETLVSGLEQLKPGGLLADITTFDEWESDASRRTRYDSSLIDNMWVIASYAYGDLTVYVHRMGVAGKRYAGIH